MGMVTFLTFSQIQGVFIRRQDRSRTAREIAALRKMGLEFEQSLIQTRTKMDDMQQAIEARTTAQSKKIVSELQVLESLMREFADRISNKVRAVAADEVIAAQPAKIAGPSYLAGMDEPALLETIRASLEENRVDLYLQPIVSLPQRKLRFYEALSRLRAEDGSVIMPAQYIKVAAPAGLMSVVDNLLLFRCVQIVRRLTQKHRDIGVFCNISGVTLADYEFFPQFLVYMLNNRDLAGQIVFEFEQSAVLKAGSKGEENLKFLSSLGFALSMDHVETLAMDFTKLKSLGFRHLKLKASILTDGMNSAQSAVAAEDFKKLLERYGLNLIVERVEEEKTVLQLLDYGVDFAQGFLFGEPRAVREDSLKAMDKPVVPDSAPVIPFKRSA
jgi:cyclic-di-GMP phosphodiesterase TipF (flagellum assembly factor)